MAVKATGVSGNGWFHIYRLPGRLLTQPFNKKPVRRRSRLRRWLHRKVRALISQRVVRQDVLGQLTAFPCRFRGRPFKAGSVSKCTKALGPRLSLGVQVIAEPGPGAF